MSLPRRSRIAVLTIALVLAACEDSTSPTPGTGQPGLTFLLGATQADTVDALLPKALVVEVRDTTGRLARGVTVRFQALADANPAQVVLVAGLGDSSFSAFAAVATDGLGQAAVVVKNGTQAGAPRVAVLVPIYGFADTASYTVTAGHAARVTSDPADTTVSASAVFPLRSQVTDRHGNATNGTATYAATGTSVTVSPTGGVTAVDDGITQIVVTAGAGADTSFVAVLPAGTIAASVAGGIEVVNLDGSGLSLLPIATAAYLGRYPTWVSPTLLAAMDGQYFGELVTVSTSGTVQYLVTDTTSTELEVLPQAAHDGSWIYFGGLVPGYPTTGISVWKVHPNGTGLARVSPANGPEVADTYPSPAPDGTMLVVATTRTTGSFHLALLNPADGQLTDLAVQGYAPRWAPSGNAIAYLNPADQVWVVNANGTGAHRVSPPGHTYDRGIDWSPSLKYIVAHNAAGGLELIEVAAGRAMRLTLPNDPIQPTWRP